MLSAIERLRLLVRPPGRGLLTVSTGNGMAANVLKLLYGSDEPRAVESAWEDSLQKIRRVDTIVLGIPSDTGAGIVRGANLGPIGVREAYLSRHGYAKNVVDIGDVVCVPQLLHDEMLGEAQKAATRQALYGQSGTDLPVSPLSIAEAVFAAIRELNPTARITLLGGDHSVSWPAVRHCAARFGDDFAVLHFDAHTDLLEERFGVKYCFATWAYHGMKLVRPGHWVQVGIRTSAKPKEYWTQTYPIHQVWAQEIQGDGSTAVAAVVEYFRERKVTRLYVSNDIDGTDMREAPATGTPEPHGLAADFVRTLISAVGAEFEVIGGDVVEVAPPLSGSRDAFASETTCVLGASYLESLFCSLRHPR